MKHWRLWTAVILLSALGFAVNTFVATQFDKRAAFDDWETMFGSDPNWYLPRLTDGTFSSKRHPLFHVFVHLPARAIASIADGVAGVETIPLRRQLVILAAPAAAAAKTALLVMVCAALGLRLRFCILIALVDLASLSRLVFGSIPESFSATAAALTWTFYLTSRALRDGPEVPVRYRAWFICGLFGLGVTLTNIVPFAILLFAVLTAQRMDWTASMARCVGLTGLVVLTGGLLHAASQILVQPEIRAAPAKLDVGASEPGVARTQASSGAGVFQHASPFIRFRPAQILRQLPLVTVSTFLGPPPRVFAREPQDRAHARASFQMPTTQLTREWVLPLAVVLTAIGLGVYGWRQGPTELRPLTLATSAILAFNLALFMVWGGGNIFMFTLHWQPCLLIVLAGGGLASSRVALVAAFVYAALLTMEILWNIRFLESVWRAL